MRKVLRDGRTGRVLLVAVLGIGAIGTAWSLAAGTSNTLHACADKDGGALRLAKKCKHGERSVSWNIQGPKGDTGAPGANGTDGVQYAWNGWVQPTGPNLHPQADGHVTTFTFTSPKAGFVDVTAHVGIRLHNNGVNDCHVQSQLAAAPGTPAPGAGYIDNYINANLPTEAGGGTYLQLDSSVSRVLPAVQGSNTVYLNGAYDCTDALWGPVNINAVFVNSNPPSSLTAP